MCAISANKLARHAIKRPFWAILPALGEYYRAIAIDSRRWANFVVPMRLTAPQDETVSTNAGASGRLHETHDAFARQNCAENRCIWLAMVSSVSPETEHTPAKAMTVSRDSPAAPVGGRGARLWCPWAVAGPGRASKRRTKPHISDQAPPVWRAPEGPEGTGGLRGAAPNEVRPPSLAGGRARRRPEHQRRRKQQAQSRIPAAPLVWRAPEGPEGTAAVPVGGGMVRLRCPWAAAGPGRGAGGRRRGSAGLRDDAPSHISATRRRRCGGRRRDRRARAGFEARRRTK